MGDSIRLFAFYLPQFHPIPENDAWWGKGFTEWTNTAKAKPLFRGHYQPHVPADLGFYDLRVPEARAAQAELARAYGIEGFCYYHYWFGGRRILERPFQEVLESGQPDFPFCLCWANQTWSGIWHGNPGHTLIEQSYPGTADHQAHFDALLPAFTDRRYAKADNKPIFLIYLPEDLPEPRKTLDLWRDMAARAGLPGLHIIGISDRVEWDPARDGYDAKMYRPRLIKREWIPPRQPHQWLRQKYQISRGLPMIHSYERWMRDQAPMTDPANAFYQCVTHAWDNTPRSGSNGIALTGSAPELFRRFFRASLTAARDNPLENKLVFLKSWNEWAEGNHLEPDLKFGHAYLKVIQEECDSCRAGSATA